MNRKEYGDFWEMMTPEEREGWKEVARKFAEKIFFVGPLKQRRTFRVSKH